MYIGDAILQIVTDLDYMRVQLEKLLLSYKYYKLYPNRLPQSVTLKNMENTITRFQRAIRHKEEEYMRTITQSTY